MYAAAGTKPPVRIWLLNTAEPPRVTLKSGNASSFRLCLFLFEYGFCDVTASMIVQKVCQNVLDNVPEVLNIQLFADDWAFV